MTDTQTGRLTVSHLRVQIHTDGGRGEWKISCSGDISSSQKPPFHVLLYKHRPRPHYAAFCGSLVQRVAPQCFKTPHSWSEEEVHLLCWSMMGKSNQEMRENWISKKKWDDESLLFFPFAPEWLFCSCSMALGHFLTSSCYYCSYC